MTIRKRKDTREAYNRVIPKTWGDMPDSRDTKLIRLAIKGVWRKLTGKPCPYVIVVSRHVKHAWRHYESGRRRGRVYVDGRYVFKFNPEQGMQSTIHSVSHFIHQRLNPRDKPHSPKHMELERTAAEYVVKRFSREYAKPPAEELATEGDDQMK